MRQGDDLTSPGTVPLVRVSTAKVVISTLLFSIDLGANLANLAKAEK